MKRLMLWSSLRTRLTVVSLLAVAVILAVAHQAFTSMFYGHVRAQFREDLTMRLDHLTARLTVNPATQRIELSAIPSDTRLHTPYSGWYWQVQTNETGSVLLRSRSLWDSEMPLPRDFLQPGVLQTHEIIGPNSQHLLAVERVVQIEDPSLAQPAMVRVSIGGDLSFVQEATAEFHRTTLIYLSFLGVLLVIVLIVQLRIGLAPLRHLAQSLTQLRRGEQSRIEGAYPAEIQPLVQEFNAVLESNEQMIERARRQSGNLAHAIKTPLAVLSAAAADSRQTEQKLRTAIATQVDTLNRQVSWHLARARASASIAVPGRTTQLHEVIHGVVNVMKRAYTEKNLRFDLTMAPQSLIFAGEKQDLQEIIGNLMDNASKWAKQIVRVRAAQIGHQIEILIEDDGPGIAEHLRNNVMKHGVRADELQPGTGLGLGIVSDLVSMYRGSISLDTSSLGGLKVCLRLPAFGDVSRAQS
ncbi:MAG: ATP-binding protein [Burkholderiaceae bacterium]|nr:ATP-binding protein [Burkholderiaceae bacterium]